MPPRDTSFPPGNDVVVSKGPCPKCASSDAFTTYGDGHGNCFSCGHHEPAPRGHQGAAAPGGHHGGAAQPRAEAPGLITPREGAFRDLGKRGLKEATLRRFGYFVGGFKGQSVHVAPYFDQAGEPAAQKVRLPNKEFLTLKAHDAAPSIGECQLFGRPVFGDRYDRKVVVCEGELDAMSVAQVSDFKFAAVSVNTGAKGAAKVLKANYLWLDRFEEIVLWFDNDEPGQAAADECARLFKVGKVKIAKAPEGLKDASDLLQADRPGDITAAIFMATKWVPAGIRNAADLADDVCAPKADDATGWSFEWVWPAVHEFLGPIKPGQVCYHVAGTGLGKTTAIAELEYDLVVRQGARCFHMGFEDTRRDVQVRLLSIHISDRLDIEPRPDPEMRALHAEVFGGGNVYLFDPETAEWTVEAIMSYVRFCAKALDCQVGFLDPLSFIAAGLEKGEDERRTLDKVSRDLAALAKELGIHLQVAHHLTRPEGTAHEEGAQTSLNQVRGSGGIANFATFVIGHERNQQAEDPEASLITRLRSLKNRPRSRTGEMIRLKYNLKTGRLLPTDEPFPTKRGNAGGSQRGGFPPADQDY
ncbi:toprim domain-containing protein [uncultured Methylobacterium sp.]|jgi:twinkle protein|uniref:toprim domain-containing protein n=1 Tax=uncultured Methylobacterium sp. TaxID=157278 RepID=UPI00260845A4|nr:toprim domain-containing protein [uncultured Methylobacterium sp.]